MRKMICLLLLMCVLLLCLVGCGNENWGIGNYTYTHAHVGTGEAGYCATVSSWHDNELGIELHTKEYGSLYCAEGTYILFEHASRCPFCAK